MQHKLSAALLFSSSRSLYFERTYATSCLWSRIESAPGAIDCLSSINGKVYAVVNNSSTLSTLDTKDWKWKNTTPSNIKEKKKLSALTHLDNSRASLLPFSKGKVLYFSSRKNLYSYDIEKRKIEETLAGPGVGLSKIRLIKTPSMDKIWAFARYEIKSGTHVAFWHQSPKIGTKGKWVYEYESRVSGNGPEKDLVAVTPTPDEKNILAVSTNNSSTKLQVFQFSVEKLAWQLLATSPFPKEQVAVTSIGNKLVIVGIESSFFIDWFKKRVKLDVTIYDLEKDEWEKVKTEESTVPKGDLACLAVNDKEVLVYTSGGTEVLKLKIKNN